LGGGSGTLAAAIAFACMAARARKLKVFAAPFGFHETLLAVPSRAAALRA
jgi:hypothetical protein